MKALQVVLVALVTIAIGNMCYSCGVRRTKAKLAAKPEPSSVQSRWMGRLVAGDGSKAVYQDPQIELGLRADGVLVWRLRAPEPPTNPPIPLKSLENTK